MRGLILASLVVTAPAFAGDVELRLRLGGWYLSAGPHLRPVMPYLVQPAWWYWVPYTPPPPPPPQIIYLEREPVREVVVVQLPPVEPPAPASVPEQQPMLAAPLPPPLPPPPPAIAQPTGPRTPGPDVFYWIDADGLVHYSTRVPADARKRARKLATLPR